MSRSGDRCWDDQRARSGGRSAIEWRCVETVHRAGEPRDSARLSLCSGAGTAHEFPSPQELVTAVGECIDRSGKVVGVVRRCS